jgi:hypothetical protein
VTSSSSSARRALVGLVLPGLDAYRQLLHRVRDDAAVDEVELSVGAPLWKGNAAIKAALAAGGGLADKIDAYVEHGLMDDAARVDFARRFQMAYLSRHPRSERQDVFAASGEVFVFAFDLRQPMQLALPREAFDAVAAGPHDAAVLARHRAGEPLPKEALRVVLRLFLDFAPNPRRHDEPAVRAVVDALGLSPWVIEAEVSPDVAGHAFAVLDRVARPVGGRAVWLAT